LSRLMNRKLENTGRAGRNGQKMKKGKGRERLDRFYEGRAEVEKKMGGGHKTKMRRPQTTEGTDKEAEARKTLSDLRGRREERKSH